MGPGVFLAVLGAILALAVRTNLPGIDLHVVGLILVVAGIAIIAHARQGTRHERVMTRVEKPADPDEGPHLVEEIISDRDMQ